MAAHPPFRGLLLLIVLIGFCFFGGGLRVLGCFVFSAFGGWWPVCVLSRWVVVLVVIGLVYLLALFLFVRVVLRLVFLPWLSGLFWVFCIEWCVWGGLFSGV